MKLKHAQQELKSKQAQVKKMDSGYKKDQDALEAVQKCRDKLQVELAKLNYEGSKYNMLLCYSTYCNLLLERPNQQLVLKNKLARLCLRWPRGAFDRTEKEAVP